MRIIVFLISLISSSCISQNHFSINYEGGLNATIIRNQKSKVDGVRYPIYPNTWNNRIGFNYYKNQFSIGINLEQGSLGLIYIFKEVYPNKYPEDINKRIDFSRKLNNSKWQGSLIFGYEILPQYKIQHFFTLGTGLLFTAYNNDTSGAGNVIELDTTTGTIKSSHLMGTYGYTNKKKYNLILNIGYKSSFQLFGNFKLNLECTYNQGVYKMFNIPFFRTFNEYDINYQEYQEFNARTNLSHFTFGIGLEYLVK